MNPHHRYSACSWHLGLLLATASVASAQTAPQPAPAEDAVVLSPFTVSTSEDRGYQAQSSLSGSRLKTDLKDMAPPVSAFTEQFLLDTAITNTDDLARYMVNTTYDLNEEANGQNSQITTINRLVKMRGLTGGDITTNFFKIGARTDTFSTERIEQARGPNAILFGVGSPGGLINATTKRARTDRNAAVLSGQVRSYDGTRIEGDYNQVILRDRLAVRVAAVNSKTNTWKNYSFNDADRLFGTAKWKINSKAELNAEFETGHMTRAVKRSFTAQDAYTPWRDAGMRLSSTANAALGIGSLGANPYLVLNENTGELWNYRNQMKTANASTVGGLPRVLTDFNLLPKETSITGPGYEQTQDYTRLSAFFTYAFTKNWSLEVAGVRLDDDIVINDNQNGFEQFLYADPNPTLPNGAPNPNAGRAYLEATPLRVNRDIRTDKVRAMSSYRMEFGKWGTHTLAGVAEYGYSETAAIQSHEYVVSANAPSLASPENANNRVFRRTYVDLNGPSSGIVMIDPNLRSTSGREILSGANYETAWIPFSANAQITGVETKSAIAMLQSSFWKNRINTVVGTSRDERGVFRSSQIRTPLPGFTTGVLTPIRGHIRQDDPTAKSFTFSGVLHATNWLSLTYSRAENSAVPDNTAAIIYASDGKSLGRFPVPRGESQDVGIKLNLLDRRLYLSAIYYQTSATHDREFSLGVSNSDLNNIWGALNRDRVIDPLTGQIAATAPEGSTAQTFNQRSQGYELELTANFTPNWRLFLNGSHATATRTAIGPEMIAHLEAVRPLWEANRTRALATPSGSVQTIGDMLTQIDRQVQTNYVIADGRRPIGQVPNKFNLRTSYDLSEGSLRSFTIGGGARYQGKSIIGYIPGGVDASGKPSPFFYYYGSEQVFADANIAYRRKLQAFGRPIGWSLQLNVDNVFNNDAFVRIRVSETGALQNYRFNDPREWILTSRFTF